MFFKNKMNIILTFVLCVILGACGFLAYQYFFATNKIIVPDFSNGQLSEVQEWCNTLEDNPCTITYDYSDTIAENYVIYQSINPEEELKDSISFIISKGKNNIIALPDLDNATKDTIADWASKNNIANITYVDENSDTIEKDFVIRIEPNTNITKDIALTVYISIGKKDSSDETITVASGQYTNLTIKEFESKVAQIGLTPEHSTSRDDYSSTVPEGSIIWHGSGAYINGEVIHYGVSLGKNDNAIVVTKGSYVGKTEDEFKTIVEALGTKGLVPSHDETWDEYSSTVTKGNIVVHGSGTYTNGETIHYGLSLGSKSDEIVISAGQYVGKSYSEYETAVKALGLVPYHRTAWDENTTDSSKVGYICKNGYGTYSSGENCSYGLYTEATSSVITIAAGKYVGKSYSDFETAIKALGLVPYHRTEWDETTSDTSKVGCISKNGNGTYEKGENCSYGLYVAADSSSSTITISSGSYVGYSESDYITAIKALGLVPSHYSAWDEYSDTVEEGKIVVNGYGTYEKGETNRYGLSLGKKETVATVTVNANAYNDKTVSEFTSAITNLGLVARHDTSKDAYDSSITKDNIIWHNSGSFTAGSTITYGLSLGVKTLYLNSKNFYNTNNIFNNYSDMVNRMTSLLTGFTKVSFVEVESANTDIGQIEYIKVNGSTSYDPGYFAADTPIEIGVVSSKKPS